MDYLARVELHGDRAREDYVLLQAELAKAKFDTTVIGGSGTSPLQLPPGTYYYYGTYPDVNSAHAAIVKALGAVPLTASVVVGAVAAWQSSNLPSPTK
jgi:hypothetical protein